MLACTWCCRSVRLLSAFSNLCFLANISCQLTSPALLLVLDGTSFPLVSFNGSVAPPIGTSRTDLLRTAGGCSSVVVPEEAGTLLPRVVPAAVWAVASGLGCLGVTPGDPLHPPALLLRFFSAMEVDGDFLEEPSPPDTDSGVPIRLFSWMFSRLSPLKSFGRALSITVE